ncbi:MAG TPA: carbohydrate-binding domain-containing protein, partial [Planctomycetota bacterium]|nr:carbohydrate-binding domain-containing protein [Planctomycetota bacterium]
AAAPERELALALGPVALACEPASGGGDLAQRPLRRRVLADSEVAFAWTMTLGGHPVASGTGHGKSLAIEATPPAVHERTPGVLSVSGTSARGTGTLEVPVTVWPLRLEPLKANRRVLLVDGPEGLAGEALVAAGIPWREAPAFPESLEKDTVLVLGEGTLDEQKERLRLVPFVERARRIGASVVVLRQGHNYPDGVAPPLDGFEPRGGRDLAVREPLDTLVTGIAPEDLEGWSGLEGALPPPAIKRPLRADARVLVEAAPLGLTDGCAVVSVEDTPMPELLCQIPLVARARTVPAARALLRALVREACEPRARLERPFFARVDADLEAELEQLALVPRAWNLDDLEKAAAPVIIIDDTKSPLTDQERAALERAVAAGATVVAHVPVDGAIERLGRLAPPGWKVEKAPSLPVPLTLASLHASDLLWPPGPGGFRDFTSRFDATPRTLRAEGTIELVKPGVVVEQPRGRGRVVLDLVRWREAGQIPQAKRFVADLLAQLGAERKEPPIRLPVGSWGGVGREGDHIMFYGNSTAQARFVARRAGRYKVKVELGGTKAHGGYPVARVVCDARHLGDVEVDGPGPKAYDLEVTIPAGVHVLSVSFTNDVYDPPEDRNMTLRGAVLELAPTRIY